MEKCCCKTSRLIALPSVLGIQMQRRPELLEANRALLRLVAESNRRNIIRQRVEPDIHRVIRIIGNGHAPTHRRLQTADGKVLKTTGHEAFHFITPGLRSDEFGTRLIEIEERFVVIGKAEEVNLFRNSDKLRALT